MIIWKCSRIILFASQMYVTTDMREKSAIDFNVDLWIVRSLHSSDQLGSPADTSIGASSSAWNETSAAFFAAVPATWIEDITRQKMSFGDLKTDDGLRKLNDHLENASYISGYVPTQADMATIDQIGSNPSAAKFPHASRWWVQCSVYSSRQVIFSNISIQWQNYFCH